MEGTVYGSLSVHAVCLQVTLTAFFRSWLHLGVNLRCGYCFLSIYVCITLKSACRESGISGYCSVVWPRINMEYPKTASSSLSGIHPWWACRRHNRPSEAGCSTYFEGHFTNWRTAHRQFLWSRISALEYPCRLLL